MTAWAGRSIARFASNAGFYGDDLKTAVAVALVASGGNDHYDVTAGIPGAGRWQGLWAIDVDEHPELAAYDMGDPYQAARAAKQLTDDAGSFGWSAVWRNGLHLMQLEHAGTETTRQPFTETAQASTGTEARDHHRHALHARLASIHNGTSSKGI
jgi:Lysozyme like domain